MTLGQGRETRLGRRQPYRESQTTILVGANGKKTEQDYFRALKDESWTRPFILEFKNKAPADLLDWGYTEKCNSGYDEVFCVSNVDNFAVNSNTIAQATAYGVGLALSKPCFDFWLLLHLKDCKKPFQNADEVGRELKKIIPKWDKTMLNFADFKSGVFDASNRAKSLGDPPKPTPPHPCGN
ncbi:RloB-like protein [Sinosporangium album]|uniref:RloB-like protein n=1 Tax=Sinosporangium album TaxID=504805 RepID=A0A1G7VWA4_9ACTN|nr:RloB family protein [Sinosporangium album]SDG63150.1 RloB-like protein [Sinosporangium album]